MSEARARPSVAVVGGSLAGLSAALLLDRLGLDVRLFTRGAAHSEIARGAGLGIDPQVLAALAGEPVERLPQLNLRQRQVLHRDREQRDPVHLPVTTHALFHDHLAALLPPERRAPPTEVSAARLRDDAPGAELLLASGERLSFDLVIGADGADSHLRALVVGAPAPGEPAGYLQARGWIAESELPEPLRGLFFEPLRLTVAPHPRQHFTAFPVPGAGGDLTPGQRRLSWSWFFRPPPDAPSADLQAPLARARGGFPEPVLEVISVTLSRGHAESRAIYELAAPRLVRGAIVLIGDAAHQISPLAGSAPRTTLIDALLLAHYLADATPTELPGALAQYESRRLPTARALVEQGRSLAWGLRSRGA